MRILWVTPLGQMGGTEKVLLDVIDGVRRQRPQWELWVWLGQDGPLRSALAALGVQVEIKAWPETVAQMGERRWAWRGLWSWWHYGRALQRALQILQPTVIQANGIKMQLTMALAKPAGSRLVWHLHDVISTRPNSARLLRWLQRRCDRAVANSHYTADDFHRAVGKSAFVIHNGVDASEFTPPGASADLDTLAGLPAAAPGTVRIGLVATYARWKGHEVFLQAARFFREDTRVRFYIVGGPIYQTQGSQWSVAELQARLVEWGLQKRCGLTGFVNDVPAVLRALDVVVHASTEPEPFGMVIAQAMACGRAVVMSSGGGASEIVEDGISALSFEPGNVDELVTQLQFLLARPERRQELGEAGRVRVQQYFARETMVEQWIGQYERGWA